MSFESIALSLPFTHAHFYNEASGSLILDHVGTANLSIGSGVTLAQPGLISGDIITCANLSNPQITDASNAYSPQYNQSWSQVFVFSSTNARTGTQSQYSLVGNINSGNNYSGFNLQLDYGDTNIPDRSGNLIPAWMAARLYMSDGTNNVNAPALCDIPNNAVNVLVFTYQYSAGSTSDTTNSSFNVWLNGSPVMTNTVGPGPTASIGPSETTYIWSGGSGSQQFNGKAQFSGIALGTILTEAQIKAFTLAVQGAAFAPTTTWYNATNGIDTSGANLQFRNGSAMWVPSQNLYYCFGMDTTGTDVLNGGNWDMATPKVACYTSPNLAFGTFTPVGTAFDTSGDGIWGVRRQHVAFNPIVQQYVMIGVWENNQNYLSDLTYSATSTTPGGPYTLSGTPFLPSGETLTQDSSLFVDDNGVSAYMIYANASDGAIRVVEFNNNWTAFSGNPTTIIAGQSLEAPIMFKNNGVYFAVFSDSEFYNAANVSNWKYCTCTTPLGTWSAMATASVANLQGSPLNSETSSAIRLPSGKIIGFGDYWYNGWLERSSTVMVEFSFPTPTTLSISPVMIGPNPGSGGSGGGSTSGNLNLTIGVGMG